MESLLQSRRETGQHRKIKENSFYQTSMKFHMVPAEPEYFDTMNSNTTFRFGTACIKQ